MWTQRRRLFRGGLACCSVGLCVATPVSAGVATFRDGTFADSDWTVVVASFRSTGGALAGGSIVATQKQLGGNPGAMWEMAMVVPTLPLGEGAETVGVHIRMGATYDPATQGPIASIDYLEDSMARPTPPISRRAYSSGPAVRQNGRTYAAVGPAAGALPDQWVPFSSPGIVREMFAELTPDGWVPDANPDLSGSGASLELGYVTRTGVGGDGRIDNWTVRVNPACAVDQDCDDGDPCTTETCSGGVCAAVDQDCSDGNPCTFEACAATNRTTARTVMRVRSTSATPTTSRSVGIPSASVPPSTAAMALPARSTPAAPGSVPTWCRPSSM